MQKLTIIIVSFNSAKIICSCLEKIDFSKHRVIVVDNASSDKTVEVIEKNFPQVEIIKSTKNIGYGRANNIGLRATKTEYALILNPDAFIAEKDIEKTIEFLDLNQETALCGPILLNSFSEQKAEIDKQIKIAKNNTIQEFQNHLSVTYIIGAILFMRMSIFQKIGFFDEDIFLYYEDDEISHRVVKNGHKASIFLDAIGFHIGHGSSGSSLRSIYKRFWHRAFSKQIWKKKQKGKLFAIKSSLRLVIVFFLKAAFYSFIFKPKKIVENIAAMCGSISFLIGLKAFDKNNNSRG